MTGAGPAADSYRKTSAGVASFGAASLLDTPAAVSVVTRTQLDDQQARLLSDVVRNDAAVSKSHGTTDPSNPRVDQMLCKVYDSETGGDASDITDAVIVKGTASGAVSGTPATALDARTGVGEHVEEAVIVARRRHQPGASVRELRRAKP